MTDNNAQTSWIRRVAAWTRRIFLSLLRRPKVFSIPVASKCEHGCPEVIAWRLCLTANAGNLESHCKTLAEFANCAGCSAAVISEVVYQLVNALNCCDSNWEEAVAARLAFLLDLQDAGGVR